MFGVKESFTSTGTGDITGLTEVSGFTTTEEAAPSSIGARVGYTITDTDGKPLERGIGYKSGATTFVREHVLFTLSSGTFSAANSALSLAAGTKYLIFPAGPADSVPTLPPRPCTLFAADDRIMLPGNITGLEAVGITPSNYNRGFYIPVRFDAPARVNGFVLQPSASYNLDIGLYTIKASTGMPGSIYVGVAATAVTSGKTVISFTEQRLVPGWYYLYLNQSAAGSFGREMIMSPGGWFWPYTTGNMTEMGVVYQSQTAGTLPTSPNPASISTFTGSGANNGKVPMVGLRLVGA